MTQKNLRIYFGEQVFIHNCSKYLHRGEEGFDQYLIDTALDPLIPKVANHLTMSITFILVYYIGVFYIYNC